MIFAFNYIIYIAYSFLTLFFIYICILLYEKYSHLIFDTKDKIILSEKSSKNKKYKKKSEQSTSNKIKNIKKQYKIKSTEKTYEEIKFICNKPNYININNNTIDKILEKVNNKQLDKIKNIKNSETIQKITSAFLNAKQNFYNTFINSDNKKYFINNLDDFYTFSKNNLNQTKYNNIILKFYNTNEEKYVFLFVEQNKIIKILYNDEYNNICNMIENNNSFFIVNDENNDCEYYIGYGNYTQSELTIENIKNIFFSNIKNYELDKNYKIFSEYKYVKIYFYVCNQI